MIVNFDRIKERGEGMNGIKCIDLIDEEKTIENGLIFCRQYASALQQCLQDKLSTPMHTSSRINASQVMLFTVKEILCSYIGKFEKKISDIEARNVVAEGDLRYKYMYDLPDTNIAKTLIRHKPKLIT